MNSSSLFALDPLKNERWRSLVRAHPSSSVFHTTGWLNALHTAYGYEPVVYTGCDPSVAAIKSGIVFCKIRSWLTGRRFVSLPFSDHCDPLVESPEELNDILSRVRENIVSEKLAYCELRPLHPLPGISNLFGASDQYRFHVIDLRPDIEAIFRRFHKSVQRNIRRAEREALTYQEGNSEELLKQFYKLVIETRKRQHLPPQPMMWFRSLVANLGPDLKIRITYKDGLPVASILTLCHKKTITYKYGCSDARMHRFGGVTLVFWNTIQQAKAAGYETMDLGRTDLGNEGLAVFKEHLGGVSSNLNYWRYPSRPRSSESPAKQRIVEKIVDLTPERVLTAAGNLLYRHMG